MEGGLAPPSSDSYFFWILAMILYTVQMCHWREVARRNIPFLDITVKSGDRAFAPTWDFLSAYKEGRSLHPGLTPEESYTVSYKNLMRKSFQEHKEHWINVINMQELAIACYCPYHDPNAPLSVRFCHRHILCELFSLLCTQYGIEFEYGGELVSGEH